MPDVVLPCLNEALALPWVLPRLPAGYRAVLADNGSTDDSAAIARAHGALVVDVPQRGFGAAVHAGLLACDADIVCVMDADASLDPADLPLVVAPVEQDEADLVLGRRRPQSWRAWPAHARLANAEVTRRLRRRSGYALHDLGPMRAGRREALLGLGVTDRRFGYPLEMVTRAADAHWRVVEVDVPYHDRAAGSRSKVTGTVRGTLRAIQDMSAVLDR